ncbi:acetate kinase [Mobilitalea sibirica]|uniref:Acetate kinase n=1 Tax=Mobilitalea sibirica TaxID=1462919 RepID=A0A8J7H0M4_9FIRM|nr:acetate kinase [Mobilitalea sibirica]MBH1939719.1 acetate kinase [Mobilitalea sibirica]
MKVLVINCGSSSLKYQLIDSETEQALAVGICERIGQEVSYLKHTPNGGDKVVLETSMKNHEIAVSMVLEALINDSYGVIKSLDEIGAVGHRVVHGGEKFAASTIITDEVIKAIEGCNDLAPLHNPANLIGIRACANLMEGVPMVAVFDTAFHQTMPPKAYLYGLPFDYYEKHKIRKYGFHGTSHSYVSKKAAEFAGLDIENSKVIVCHLGNGASISAVLNGKSIDTSMGFTPLSGLVMGTRSGDIDPSIIEFISKRENKTIDQVMNLLNKESGVWGMSEVSSDFRDINVAMDSGNEKARLAFELFVYRVAKYIGGYVAAMNGVDVIAFTAGVGENDHKVREWVCEYLGYLGVTIDLEKNKARGVEIMLTTPESKVKVCIMPTNEELAIARETVALL